MNYEALHHRSSVPVLNPNYEHVSERVYEWARKKGLFLGENDLKRSCSQKHNKFAPRLFPDAGKEELEQITRLFLVLFYLDDRADSLHGNRRVNFWKEQIQLNRQIAKGNLSAGDAASAETFWQLHWGWFRDRSRERKMGTRLVRYVGKFLKAGLWEAKNLAKEKQPTIIKYVHQLKHCSGAGIAVELLGYLRAHDFPVEVFHHRCLGPLYQTITEIICFSNDLASYEKEERDSDFHNLVLLKEYQYKIPRKQAEERVRERLEFLEEVYRKQQIDFQESCPGSPPHKQALGKAIDRMIKGMHIWATRDTVRYSPNNLDQ
ncbi:terpene synthase family protein [Echinicola rosea]|uniref:Terpene synthase n=1 Tax=Echinicola rosea TaxID=1807691 RepID=A0ABQ1VB14_9BACT|nr:hypothetical protein [Echinicola rosea]GGF44383.1 hypothetical protein GCM10011339_36060 [Echinicola rosea]